MVKDLCNMKTSGKPLSQAQKGRINMDFLGLLTNLLNELARMLTGILSQDPTKERRYIVRYFLDLNFGPERSV